MPAAIPLIAMVLTTAAKTSPMWTAVIIGASSIVAGALTKAMTPDMEKGSTGSRVNGRATTMPLGIPYGICRVWCDEVFIEASGEDNKYLWIVHTIGEGECDSILQVNGVDQVLLNDKVYTEYGNNVDYWFYNGSSVQNVNPNLQAIVPEWTDPLRNTAYIIIRLKHNLDVFQSLPSRSVVIKGRKIYDPRTATTGFNSNAALVLYDYLTNKRFGRKWPTSIINVQSVIDAANYCDTKGWTFNKNVTEWNSQNVVDDIQNHFRGLLIWSEGQYHFRYSDINYESSVFNIKDEHIYQDSSKRAQISIAQPSGWTKPDSYSCAFTDPDKFYATDYILIPNSGGGGVIEEVSLEGFLSKEKAMQMGTFLLERSLLDRSLSGVYREDLWELEPNDLVTHSSSAFGLDSQLLRVQSVSPSENGIAVSFIYENETLYDDTFNIFPEDVYSCNLPDFSEAPGSIRNVVITEVLANWRLRSQTSLKVVFDRPETPYFDKVAVYRSYDDVTYEFLFYSEGSFTVDNVEEGVTYYLRIKSISIYKVAQTDNNDYKINHTVGGASSIVPSSLTALKIVSSGVNSINLHAEQIFEADIDQYEFRLGPSWTGGLFLFASKAPNYSLQGLKPGSHTFWVCTKSDNGLYGGNPRSASISVSDPIPGWGIHTTQAINFSTGTRNNTEVVTYGGEPYLKCSHTGGVLSGTYLTPIIDVGVSNGYLFYILADIVVTGQGTDWNSIAPSPITWTQLGLDNKWSDLIELTTGPSVKMKVSYGETTSLGNVAERQEVLAAFATGRYFQIEIIITDPIPEVEVLVENLTLKWCTP